MNDDLHSIAKEANEGVRIERISKWAGRLFRPVVDWMFLPLERDHCYRSWLSEKNGRQLHPSYRES